MAYENGRQVNRYEKKQIGKRKQKKKLWWGWKVGDPEESWKPWMIPDVSGVIGDVKKITHRKNRAEERRICQQVDIDAPLENSNTYHKSTEFAWEVW